MQQPVLFGAMCITAKSTQVTFSFVFSEQELVEFLSLHIDIEATVLLSQSFSPANLNIICIDVYEHARYGAATR